MRNPSCEIVETDDGEIRVFSGDTIYTIVLNRFYSTKNIIDELMAVSDKAEARRTYPYTKSINVIFYKKHGIRPSNLRKIVNAAVKKRLIEGKEDIFKRYCFSMGGNVKWDVVHLINERFDVIQQVRKDGLDNIEPFVVYLGKTPSELKTIFGKGLWKKLCKNSMTKNKKIASYLYQMSRHYKDEKQFEKMRKLVLKMNDIPSTAMVPTMFDDWDFITWMLKYAKGDKSLKSLFSKQAPVENIRWLGRLFNIYGDTKRLAGRLNAHFSEEWSVEKLHEKHDEYTARVYEQQFSKETFPYVGVTKVDNVEYEKYTATLIKSAYDLAQEGREMRHCVGGYHGYCTKGSYYVYSITKNGEKYSTLAFWYDTKAGFTFSQHYKAFNRDVDCDKVLKLAEIVHDRLLFEWYGRKSEYKHITTS